jgi:hypothetical protein
MSIIKPRLTTGDFPAYGSTSAQTTRRTTTGSTAAAPSSRPTGSADSMERAARSRAGGASPAPAQAGAPNLNAALLKVKAAKPQDVAAVLLAEASKLKDPAAVASLLSAAAGALATAPFNEANVKALLAVGNLATPAAAASLAKTLAAHVKTGTQAQQLGDWVKQAVTSGSGSAVGAALVGALQSAGKTEAASKVATGLTAGLSAVRAEFEKAQARVDALNEELGNLVSRAQGLLTPDQLQVAMEDFRKRNAGAYEALETAGARYAAAMGGAVTAAGQDGTGALANLRAEAQKFIGGNLEALGQTVAGAELLGAELELLGKGSDNLFSRIQKLNGDVGVVKNLAETAFEAAATLAAADPKRLGGFLDGLRGLEGPLGLKPGLLEPLLDDVARLQTATGAELKAVTGRIEATMSDLGIASSTSRLGRALGGLSVVAGTIGIVDGVRNFGEAGLAERAKVVADGLSTGVDALQVFGKAARFTKFAGPLAGAVSSVLEGLSAVQAFRDGDMVLGFSHTASALGGGLLAVAAVSSAIPGGAVVGGVLLAVGAGLGQYAKVRESNKYEGPLEDFLRAGGMSQKLAEELSNHGGDGFPAGPALNALASHLDMDMTAFMAFLETKSESELQRFIERAVHALEPNAEGEFVSTGPDAEALRSAPLEFVRPSSLEGLAVWAARQGMLPPGVRPDTLS